MGKSCNATPTMPPASPDDLFALLDSLGIAHETITHPAVFTVAESEALDASIPGAGTKNLFLKDKKGALALFSAAKDATIDLNAFSKASGYGRFSFGSPDLLLQTLGVVPGSVTAFGLMNDHAHKVRFFLHDSLWRADRVCFHPLRNDMTTLVSPAGLARFLAALERDWRLVRLGGDIPRIDAPPTTDHVEGV